MLILQSSIVVITYVPYSINLGYTEITRYKLKSQFRIGSENIFSELAHLCSYIFFASSFYVSILTNIGFRRQLKRSLNILTNTDILQPPVTTVTINRVIPFAYGDKRSTVP